MRPIKRSVLSEEVEKKVKALIFSDNLKVGDKLPSEEELAKQLQVGRRSVREALRSLQTMGFIEIKHGKGAFVSRARLDGYLGSLAESIHFELHEERTALLQLLEIRKLLEAGISSLSATRGTSPDFETMEKALRRQEKAIRTKDLELFNVADMDFHSAVVKGSQNDILAAVYDAFYNLMLETRRTNKSLGALPQLRLLGDTAPL